MINKVSDEKMGNYFFTLTEFQKAKWLASELYQINELNISNLPVESIDYLKRRKTGKKVLSSAMNYNILHNPYYEDAFQFKPNKPLSDKIIRLFNCERQEDKVTFNTTA